MQQSLMAGNVQYAHNCLLTLVTTAGMPTGKKINCRKIDTFRQLIELQPFICN